MMAVLVSLMTLSPVPSDLNMTSYDTPTTISISNIARDPAVTTPDRTNPDYYKKNGLECFDAQRAGLGLTKFQGYLEGCVYKYLWRWESKNGKEDLQKAAVYLAKLIETVE